MGAPVDLVDPFGRVIRDLRISVTDRCNFRCTYCMPEEGMVWLPRSEVLTFEEIERIARLMVERYGVESIRLTGGEPTVRAPPAAPRRPACRVAHRARPVDLAMTTNGATLRGLAGELREAGLRRINISLDTLDRQRFVEMTRRDELDHVLDGIDAAQEVGFDPVKINTVVQRGVNDDEIVDLAEFGRDHGVEVRFIEFMPLDASGGWNDAPSSARTRSSVASPPSTPSSSFPPVAPRRPTGGATSTAPAPSVSSPASPSRSAATATACGSPPTGQLRTCLFATDEFDLRAAMRDGEDDDQLAARIERAVGTKWAGHRINQVDFVRPKRSMSQIGG